MKKNPMRALGSCFMGLTLAASMVPMAAGTAVADTNPTYWKAPESAVTIDTSKIMKTYGVRAGSAGGEFVGLSNTNFDFTKAGAHAEGQYTDYSASSLNGVVGAGIAIWATSVNENVNPFYANLVYNANNTGSTATQATTWSANPNSSAWGDSDGQASQKADGSGATINGLEFSPEIIFGANKTTNWNNMDVSTTNIGQAVAADPSYDPTFTNNDSTNLWTQIYTINQLGLKADEVKGDKTVRYDNNSATTGALSYEKALRGNLLWIASQIDQGMTEKKTVAYLYAIDANNTGYFFIPQADGLISGNDTGQTATSKETTPDANYAANNGTIDLDYMDTLPFITDTFTNGTPVEGGIVMKCEDIWKSNPAVSVQGNSSDAPLAGVDVIIYNSTVNTDLQGTSGGKNSSGINNAAALTEDIVSAWAQSVGFDGAQIIAGDDFGTSTNQGYGTVSATEDGMSPLLYCQRNYTTDKPARAAWAFSQVYPELYGNNADASYAYWVDKVYHVNTEDVATVVKYMTNQSDEVTYTEATAALMEQKFEDGLLWWTKVGSQDTEWNKYAYYNGSSRASYYNTTDKAAESEEAKDVIGIFAPTTTWASTVTEIATNRLAGDGRYDTMSEIVSEAYADGSCAAAVLTAGSNWPDALAASSVAGTENMPVLLSDSGVLSDQTKAEIERLGVKTIYIVGGEASISGDVANAVAALNGGIDVQRISGADRQATSVEATKWVANKEDFDTVIIAAGKNYADALSISPYAYASNKPIVLAQEDGTLTSDAVATIAAMGAVTNIVIVGGENSVAASVQTQLGENYSYSRLAGEDRYETSALIAQWEILLQDMTASCAAIADGKNFPDALAGAALSGSKNSVLLLVDDNATEEAVDVLDDYAAYVKTLYVYGGTNSVSADVVSACAAAAIVTNE